MWTLVAAVVTVGVPALLAFGSSERRRLSLIRDQTKTWNDLPDGHPARDILWNRIDEASKPLRKETRATADRKALVGGVAAVVGAAGLFTFITIADQYSGLDEMFDEASPFRSTVAMIGAAVGLAGYVISTRAALPYLNLSRLREQLRRK